jgi:hypothetical protein
MIRALILILINIGRASADDALWDPLWDTLRSEEPPLLSVLRGDKADQLLDDDKLKAALQMHLRNIKSRMKVDRSNFGDGGTLFRVWIDPPEKPSFDAKKFEGLSKFAEAVDVPCEEIEIWLSAYGPGDERDLHMMVGFRRFDRTGGIILEFHLPKSHSGQVNRSPGLVLMCSKIHKADGKLVDFLRTPISLVEPLGTKQQQSDDSSTITK